ncbi:MAG: hypothetical protein IPI90_10605 [Saprospiraceae bacterium]|nr:hypothetical protein [Candidatus Vicinibacter affinis]
MKKKILSQIDGLSPRRMLLIRVQPPGWHTTVYTLEVRDLVTSEELNEIMCASRLKCMQKWLFHFVGSFGDTKRLYSIPTPDQL